VNEPSRRRRQLPQVALLWALLLVAAAAPVAAAESGSDRAPTLSRMGQHKPLLTSFRPFAPMLAVRDGSDIAALRTGAPVARPLEQQLQLLFEAFFSTAAQGSTQTVQLQVGYSYALAPEPAPRTQVHVAFVPFSPFAVPGDWSPGTACHDAQQDSAFVCQVATAIHSWFEQQHPSTSNAQLTFDLAAPHDSTLPLAQARGLTLALADVTNL